MPYLGIAGTRIPDEVRVEHCLTHTSGIGDDADEESGESYEALFRDRPNYAIRETADFLPQFVQRPHFVPGEGVRYNNVSWVLLGLMIERATGVTYRDYIQAVHLPTGRDDWRRFLRDGRHVFRPRRALRRRRGRRMAKTSMRSRR